MDPLAVVDRGRQRPAVQLGGVDRAADEVEERRRAGRRASKRIMASHRYESGPVRLVERDVVAQVGEQGRALGRLLAREVVLDAHPVTFPPVAEVPGPARPRPAGPCRPPAYRSDRGTGGSVRESCSLLRRMGYNWWVLLHLVGVFGFLAAHGVSIAVAFSLRRERDPAKVNDLLQLSAASSRWFYVSLAALALGGHRRRLRRPLVVAGLGVALGDRAGRGHGRHVRARRSPSTGRSGSSRGPRPAAREAVTDEQFDALLRSRTPDLVTLVGTLGLVALIYLMLFKPTFASSTPRRRCRWPSGSGASAVRAADRRASCRFGTTTLRAPADTPFKIMFDNQAPGVAAQHVDLQGLVGRRRRCSRAS